MAHRIAVMDHGRVMQVSPPADLYEQPNCRWVAEFIGDINIVEVTVVAQAADHSVLETAAGRRFAVAAAAAVDKGARAFMAVRPEKIRIALTPPLGGGLNHVAGRVVDIGYLGDMSIYKVRLDDGATMRASLANARRGIERDIQPDQPVWLSWPPEAALLLAS